MSAAKKEKLTRKERDFLVKIVENRGSFPIRLNILAKQLGVKSPTAYEVVRRLSTKGYAISNRGMIVPTEKGIREYGKLIMAHRVMESIAFSSGKPLQSACAGVCDYDYLMDREIVERIWNMLGKPKRCPHGMPIGEGSVSL